MHYDHILIRYGELTLKGQNRKSFIAQLRRNIKAALAPFPDVKIDAAHERMILHLHGQPHEPVIEIVRKIFGVQSLTPVMIVKKDVETIQAKSLEYIQQLSDKIKTFKVETKRTDKSFPLESYALSRAVGAHILINAQPIAVDVHEPDLTLQIEIKPEAAFISGETVKAVGGLPVGTSGRAMLLLSGGIDSPVAGYLTMKRGVEIEAIHFESPPFTSERARQKVIDLSQKLAEVNGHMVLHVVPFTAIQKMIHEKLPANYTITIMRRVMIQIADDIRVKRKALAIVTGENLGQVASQTLESIFTINEVSNTPILRPLISMDKNEIITIAREITTFDISIRPYEDCCTIFKPANPKTKPRREKVNQFESQVDFAPLIAEAVEQVEVLHFYRDKKENDSEAFADLF